MLEPLRRRNYSHRTARTYLRIGREFAEYFHIGWPDKLSPKPHPPAISKECVLHLWPFAKYAVVFPRMSRFIFTRADSARNRLISICSTLTALLLAGPFGRPSRFALPSCTRFAPPHSRTACSSGYALARLYHPSRFLLELQPVLRSCRLCHLGFLALFNHSARDTLLGRVRSSTDSLNRSRMSLPQVLGMVRLF